MSRDDAAVEVRDLFVNYRTPLRQQLMRAVRGVSFSVRRGEVFGFLGPNGAGKTTTIRVLMGLMRATSGSCSILGHPVPSRAARERLGFMPEAPYFYEYLTAREMIDLAGRLFGIDAATRRKRAGELLELVGIPHAADTPVRKYSKGMMQRAGIAQALINDPEVVVLDEPMSGLDPIGRKEVRDIIEHLRDRGKTVFFSTHILPDVEIVCDRVAIIAGGLLRDIGSLTELLEGKQLGTDVEFRVAADVTDDQLAPVRALAASLRRIDREVTAVLAPGADLNAFLAAVAAAGGTITRVGPRGGALEDLFLEHAAAPRAEAAS